MKKTLAVTLGILMMGLSSFASNEIKRLDKNEIKNMPNEQRKTRIVELENRVNEIKNKDLRSMDKSDKKEIKSELRYIEKELKTHERGGGIYLSVTALLVIILIILII